MPPPNSWKAYFAAHLPWRAIELIVGNILLSVQLTGTGGRAGAADRSCLDLRYLTGNFVLAWSHGLVCSGLHGLVCSG